MSSRDSLSVMGEKKGKNKTFFRFPSKEITKIDKDF